MAETVDPSTQKQRKSVAFSEGTVIMDTNGEVTQKIEQPAEEQADKSVDEVTELFKGLSKKKKTKKPKDAEGGEEEAGAAADGEFDPTALKKKKKKPKKVDAGDFEAKLAEAGIAEKEAEENKEAEVPEGDLEAGTGIWAHDASQAIPYSLLVSRFFSLIQSHHPDLLSSGTKSYKIPPPQCLREGNRRTIFANIADICKRMKRSDDHVMQFLFAELGTSGSVDGSRRLVIKGRFQQKQIENVLRRYIVEYVTCKTCRSPDTELNKGENRLYFVTCNSCGSRRSVAAIKTGFRGQVGRRKRQG
ncbi:domain found in IF2B/IF5-domain-containing protein [Aspergillus karnatakaensis]|uniref:translation initiation factor eIF2 subunit beta n=1 Tax=Aspergillus karnatakaensis TaxID=1810916 RepID=UPI003CCCC775